MWSSFKTWWAQPFDSQGSAWNWALFIGLILVIIVMWGRVIKMLENVEEAVLEAA